MEKQAGSVKITANVVPMPRSAKVVEEYKEIGQEQVYNEDWGGLVSGASFGLIAITILTVLVYIVTYAHDKSKD